MNIVKKNSEPATEVIAHDVEPLVVNTDASSYARLGWVIVLGGVLSFVLWASLAPLDKGVPMGGVVTKETNRKAIQPLTGGMVQDILVHDGDVVKAGQVLVRLNGTQSKAALDITLAQYFAARSAEARLSAELQGAKAVPFPKELVPYKADPRVQENVALQEQLFNARQLALQSELLGIQQNIEGIEEQTRGLEMSRDNKKMQLDFVKEQLDNNRELAKEGYVARSRLLDLERSFAQVNGAIAEDVGNIGRARRQVAELNLRRTQRQQEYQRDVRSQLSDVQKEADALESRIKSQLFDVDSVELKSPVDGIVVGSNVFTRGGVVGTGAKLMDIVPSGDALVVEGQLPVNLIDKVHAGLPVDLIFSAFNGNRTPHIPGVVTTVSADRFVDEKTGQPSYKVRAKVTPEGAKLIASKRLEIVSGMPVELFVKTGERTMMSYLLKPVIDRSKYSLSED